MQGQDLHGQGMQGQDLREQRMRRQDLCGQGLSLEDSPFLCCACLSISGGRARIGLCTFARLLFSFLRVMIGDVLTVTLTYVLHCKGTVNFPFLGLVTTLYPHSCGHLWLEMLIQDDVFFF